jgi:hypothetical protein
VPFIAVVIDFHADGRKVPFGVSYPVPPVDTAQSYNWSALTLTACVLGGFIDLDQQLGAGHPG